MKFYRNIAFIALMCAQGITTTAQTNNEAYGLNKVIPASLNAAALGKYGDVPVGLYTGIPSISVPIYEAQTGRIKVPIALSYHAGGIKVEEIASWAGLGWSLSAGGVISRTVMGLPDEGNDAIIGSGYFNTLGGTRIKTLIDTPFSGTSWRNQVAYCLTKIRDGEPDVFNFSFNGFSGKFFYHQEDQKFYTIPASNLVITKIDNPGSPFTFQIVDENGLQYAFELVETNHVPNFYPNISDQEVDFPTSWFLTSIHDPVTNRHVDFSYESRSLSYETMKSEVQYFGLSDSYFSESKNITVNRIATYRLKTIDLGSGHHIDFIAASSGRLDLAKDTALQYIKVFSNTKELKRIELKHGYFQSDNIPTLYSDTNTATYAKRLRLDSVFEYNTENNSRINFHAFEYSNVAMPHRLSYAQDLWGYCNGQFNANTLIPRSTFNNGGTMINLPGANRSIDSTMAQACILKKVIYPTGGHTEFSYESNRIPFTGESYDKVEKVVSESQDPMNPAEYLEVQLVMNEPDGGASVNFGVDNFDLADYHAYNSPAPPFVVTLTNVSTNSQVVYFDDRVSSTHYVPNGTYTLKIDFTDNPYTITYYQSNVIATWLGAPANRQYTLVGGLRIKQMKTFDPVTGQASNIKNYFYTQEQYDTASSGWMSRKPVLQYTVNHSPMNVFLPADVHLSLKRFQYSQYPLTAAGGAPVEYHTVTVIESDGVQNLKMVTVFESFDAYPDEALSTHDGDHFKPLTMYDHFRGFERTVKEYSQTATGYQLVRRRDFEYSNLNGQRMKFAYGLNGGWSLSGYDPIEVFGESYLDGTYTPIMGIYKLVSDRRVLSKTTETVFDATGGELSTVTTHSINPKNFLPAEVKTKKSNGDSLIQRMKYSIDYLSGVTAPTGTLASIVALADGNMNNVPIEIAEFNKRGTTEKLLSARVILYNSQRQPMKVIGTNALLSSYAMSSAANNTLVTDANLEDKVEFSQYDDFGNLLEQRKSQDVTYSFIWDYDAKYPVAEVVNAPFSQIAYSSFEADGKGNWSFTGSGTIDATAPTGKKVYTITANSNLNRSGLDPLKTYVVSLWSKDNLPTVAGSNAGGTNAVITPWVTKRTEGSWKVIEATISNASAVSLNAASATIDELRLFPKDAQMSTLTYEPLVGITSQSDANNKITYYEYDALNRLKLIRDQNRKILKSFQYKYLEPQQ